MVRVGDFTVNLVRADTKEVFKEHTGPDNNVYAEVEPGLDYFIRVETSSRGELVVRTKVDGVRVHKMDCKRPISCKYVGNFGRTNGQNQITALRFNSAAQASKEEGGQSNSSMLTGKVEVEFYERGAQTGPRDLSDFAPKQLSSDTKVGGKKCVLSGNGSHCLSSKAKRNVKYERGKRLCTITLHYCTAMGLILNKILDAPPPSSQAAPLVPAPPVDNETKASAKPEKKVKPEKKRSASAAMLPPPDENENKKVAAAIDLTGDSDDDENERWL